MSAEDTGSASHASHDFDPEMNLLRERLIAMATRCREQLHVALDAFWSGSKDKMADVEASDRMIDRDDKSIDALVLRILALRQPVASDLRFLSASFKLVTDLERIGDEAVDLARTAAASPRDGDLTRTRLQSMTETGETMLEGAVGAFFESSHEGVAQVLRTAESVRSLDNEVFRGAVGYMAAHPTEAGAALSFVTVAKCLQQIAEHAANVARWASLAAGEEER
jgi:phosphate transport system protein